MLITAGAQSVNLKFYRWSSCLHNAVWFFLYADTYTVCTCRLHYTFNHVFFGFNYLLPAAACHLGVRKGQDCKVEDTDGGYVFDLNPLARHTWNNKINNALEHFWCLQIIYMYMYATTSSLIFRFSIIL